MKFALSIAALIITAAPAMAETEFNNCNMPTKIVNALGSSLPSAVNLPVGSALFSPQRMWLAIVDRQGQICAVTSVGDAWPGSRAIAIAKASTANDFSNGNTSGSKGIALSTANLYGPTQPGGSLYGLNNSNPFNPAYSAQGSLSQGPWNTASNGPWSGQSSSPVPGGIITFGGGFPIYQNGQVIGGIGVSGDTSCADNAVAFEVRYLAGKVVGALDPVSNNIATVGGGGTDNILYYPLTDTSGGPNKADPSEFAQPHCLGSSDPYSQYQAKD